MQNQARVPVLRHLIASRPVAGRLSKFNINAIILYGAKTMKGGRFPGGGGGGVTLTANVC